MNKEQQITRWSDAYYLAVVWFFIGLLFGLVFITYKAEAASTYWEDDDGLIYVDPYDCPDGRNYVLLFDVGTSKRLQEWGACSDVNTSYIDSPYRIYDRSHRTNGSSSQFKIPKDARGQMIVHTAPLNIGGQIKGSMTRVPTTNLMIESWTSAEVMSEISNAGGSVVSNISLIYTGGTSSAFSRANELMALTAATESGYVFFKEVGLKMSALFAELLRSLVFWIVLGIVIVLIVRVKPLVIWLNKKLK